ncbi:MAG: 3-hydroxyacyl-CoA dehydrogenase NAD-binding domain-containing protein [Bacteroidota bacterium]|nr:3-hydroxyacyl-CoA dehydrogenase NAD-binding domain-containing protein [Bacteroidota bacterium]
MIVGIIGAGTMGREIALLAAGFQHDVYVFDPSESAIESAKNLLVKNLRARIEKGKITEEVSKKIEASHHWIQNMESFLSCDIVIEAIVENVDIKKNVFSQLEQIVSPSCIIASNTSSISITSLASSLKNPGRFIGIHFFNPASLMPLVEIIPALQTSPDVIARAQQIIASWNKSLVLAKDTPGFIVNRIARPYYGEAIKMLEEGIASEATIDWAMTELCGFKMGPFTLMDFIGHDVNYLVTEIIFKEFYFDNRYKPSFTQKRLLEAGYLGRKSGKGFYEYADNSINPLPDKNEELGKKISNRILVMLINEAADALYQNIATRDDIDISMTKGVNYPIGLLKWADEMGIQNCVLQLDMLFDYYHDERYRCSPILRNMAEKNVLFYT